MSQQPEQSASVECAEAN